MSITPWYAGSDDMAEQRIHRELVRATAQSSLARGHCEIIPEPDWVGPASDSWQEELAKLRAAVRSLDNALESARQYANRIRISGLQS